MKILTLDTATEASSCALFVDGDIQERSVIAPRKNADFILTMIDELLAEAEIKASQLDGIAFGCGPGSFTGLRIACGVTQGIAFALDIPVAPISCLAALAQAAYQDYGVTEVLATLDARMGEIYYGFYEVHSQSAIMERSGDERVNKAQFVKLESKKIWHAVGSGWTSYSKELTLHLGEFIQGYNDERYPQAKAMIPAALVAFESGRVVSAEHAQPVYCREATFCVSKL